MHPGVQLHARRIVAAAGSQAGAAGAAAGGSSTPGSTPSGSPALGKKGKKGPSPLGGANAAAAGGGVGAAGGASAMEVEQQVPLAVSVESLNLARKILHLACHPCENILAVAATNNLYIFQNPSGTGLSLTRHSGSDSAPGCGLLALDDPVAACGTGAGRRCGSRHGSRSNSLAASQSGHSREHSPVSRAAASTTTSASGSASNVFNAMHSRPLHEPEPMSIP